MRTEELKHRAGVVAAALTIVSLGAPASVAFAQAPANNPAPVGTPAPDSPPTQARATERATNDAAEASESTNELVKHLLGQTRTEHGEWTWGLGVPFLRMGVLRRPDEPGFRRNYEVDLQWLNPQLTFQVTYRPNARPWRIQTRDRTELQVMSLSGVVVAGLDTQNARKSEVALGLTLDFLNGIIGVGVAVDLYRGIPVLSGTGMPGGDAAPTGLLAAAFTRDGEVTVENVFFLLNLNFVAMGQTEERQ